MGGTKKDDNIRVAIRMRPFNEREKALGSTQAVVVQGNACTTPFLRQPPNPRGGLWLGQVVGEVPKENNKATGRAPAAGKTFFYDYAYDSTDNASSKPASNASVSAATGGVYIVEFQLYDDIGKVILDNAMDGYNGCLFAYGQTGSGKSYSMLGGSGDPGEVGCTV